MNAFSFFFPSKARSFGATVCALVLLVATNSASASGTRVGFKDAFAMARGNAFVATADNPSAVYYNPAGLTQNPGQQLRATVYDVSVQSDYHNATSSASMDDSYKAVPQFFYSYKPDASPWAFGLGVYAPFGLSTEWAPDSPLRTFALKNKQTYLSYNLSAAYSVSSTLSVGAGLTYNRVTTDLSRAIGVFGPTDLFRFKGDGHAVGYNLGMLWKPTAEHSFGISYQAHTSVKMNGTTDTIPVVSGEPSTATFEFPDVLIMGYSYRPTPQWNLEINLDWTNWDRLNTVTIDKASGAVPLAFNWQSGFFYEFGVTRYLTSNWNVSAGYLYTENSVPDSTYTPAVPDANRNFYSFGVGYTSGNIGANIAWHHAESGARTVTGSPPSLTGATADGIYQNSIDALSLSLEWRF